jgi:ubiquinone/menaquinone biosynthesis C-methylase UbiE
MEGLGEYQTVHAFDHVAINDRVTACDMSSVPLESNTLDDAVFCLSLMGANFTDYLREAHRTLKVDGTLHIWEAESRFGDVDQFCNDLFQLGFRLPTPTSKGQFIHIEAIKDPREPRQNFELKFSTGE